MERLSKFADETVVHTSLLMGTEHSNFLGSVHGGHVLHMADNMAYVCGARFAGTVCVTASVDRVDFHEPVQVGELLHLEARVVYAGRTSMDIAIEVSAENVQTSTVRHTNSCRFTMVALKDRKPSIVPNLICRSREDKIRFYQAKIRRELNRQRQQEQQEFEQNCLAMNDSELDVLVKAG